MFLRVPVLVGRTVPSSRIASGIPHVLWLLPTQTMVSNTGILLFMFLEGVSQVKSRHWRTLLAMSAIAVIVMSSRLLSLSFVSISWGQIMVLDSGSHLTPFLMVSRAANTSSTYLDKRYNSNLSYRTGLMVASVSILSAML